MPPVSYAAFGHIHKPQPLPGTVIGRYAGSIIPIDFGEEGEQKGAVVVEATPGRAARVEFVSLAAGRPLELDAIGGAIVRAARRHGQDVPVTEELIDLVRSHAD